MQLDCPNNRLGRKKSKGARTREKKKLIKEVSKEWGQKTI